MLCGDRSLVKLLDTHALAITLRCRSWGCEHCREDRKRQLIALATRGTPDRFVTLTIRPSVGISPADRAARLARAWRVVLARWRRLNPGKRHQYLAVFEATKRGEPHLHILVRGPYIDQRWLSAQMADVVQSPIVDIRKVRSVREVARYIGKYIGKAPHKFGKCKRYWCTVGWSLEPKEPDAGSDGWVIDERATWIIAEDWRAAGATVESDGSDGIRATWPAWRAEHYPRAGPWAQAAGCGMSPQPPPGGTGAAAKDGNVVQPVRSAKER